MIFIQDNSFYVYEDSPSGVNWSYDSANDGQVETNWKENTVSAKIKHLGITDIVRKYAEYRVEFSNGEKGEILEKCNVADIIGNGDIQSSNELQIIRYDDDNTVKFKVLEENAKSAYYNFKSIKIHIYESEDKPLLDFVHA